MSLLKTCLLENISLKASKVEEITSRFDLKDLDKGEFLLQAGSPCREMAFIDSGYMRMYDLVDGKEITLWIGGPKSFVTSLSSFVFETPNYWNIQAITECTLWVISREAHEELLKTIPQWLEFDNLLLARAFAVLEQNMFSHLHTTAQQRFENLMNENPAIFNHVPLQYIASMLGMTPETLSRLRKKSHASTS